jgi:hypothetical protein
MESVWLSLLFGAPWFVAIAWSRSRAPRIEAVPASMGERALQRLPTI